MCGVAFISDYNKNTAPLLHYLAYGIRHRGGDSWGMTNGRQSHRALGPVTRSYFEPGENWYGRPILLHTRAATVGDVTEANCHPFDITGSKARIQGIHNGSVSNWRELNEDYKRNLEVDSAQIFAHLADGLSPSEVTMRGVIAWLEDDKPAIHVARSGSMDLHIARLWTGELVGCSTFEPINFGAEAAGLDVQSVFKLVENEHHYIIHPMDVEHECKDKEKMEVFSQMTGDVYSLYKAGPMVFGCTFHSYGTDRRRGRHMGWGPPEEKEGNPTQTSFQPVILDPMAGKKGQQSNGSISDSSKTSLPGKPGTSTRGGRAGVETFQFQECLCCDSALSPTSSETPVICKTCLIAFTETAIEDAKYEQVRSNTPRRSFRTAIEESVIIAEAAKAGGAIADPDDIVHMNASKGIMEW